MSRTILIECSPRRPADGVVVPVRLVFKSVARANFLGVQWQPAVVSVPAFESSLGFDGRNFAAAPSPQVGEQIFALTQATRFAASLVWTNAAITIRHAPWTATGGDPADGDFATIWTGQAEDISTGNGQARVRLLDNGQALRVPTLAAKFGSTGDALLDGADALKDRSAETRVPRAWGKLLSIPALLVDRVNNIWLFAGNAATSVQAFYDGGAAFTLGTARASLAELQANVPASGAVDYALDASGKFLARPWTTPTYPFTAAATFGNTTAAGIASAIVTGRTAVAFTAGTVSAFNALQGAECGLYLDDDTTVAAALDRLFSGLGAWWRLNSAGTITLGRWAWGTPTLTIPAHRRHAPERLRVLAPTRRRSLGYARNDRVHNESEIARILTDAAYADGTSIDALRPAQINADRTAVNTASGIAGQGALATLNSAAWATQISGPGKPVTYRIRTCGYDVMLGGTMPGGLTNMGLINQDTNTGIVGLGAMINVSDYEVSTNTWRSYWFDTLNNPYMASPLGGSNTAVNCLNDWLIFLNGDFPGAPVAPRPVIVFSHDYFIANRSAYAAQMYKVGASRGIFNSPRAPGRSAYALIGFSNAGEGNGAEYLAGVLNTAKAYIDVMFQLVGGIPIVAGASSSDARDLVFADGITIEARKPAQVDADRTILNTAAAIAGQGAFATRDVAQFGIGLGRILNEAGSAWITDAVAITSLGTASAIAGQGALATLNTVNFATQVTGFPSGLGQVTVGAGQDIKKYMIAGQTVFVDGGYGATGATGTFGNRQATLLANGSTFATGADWYAGPAEQGNGTVSGSYTHSGASAIVSFMTSYSGSAVVPENSQIFTRA